MQHFIKRCFHFLYKRIRPQTTTKTTDISLLKSEEALVVEPSEPNEPNPQEINELMVLFNGGRYVETAALAQILTARFPLNGFVWNALAISLQMQGKDGLFAMQKAAVLLPNDAEVQRNIGIIFTNLGQFNNAMASYRRAVDIKPDFAEAHCNLGDTLLRLGQFDEAAASYRQVLALKPDLVEAHYNLGNALLGLEQFDHAVASYHRALAIKPDFADAHYYLGMTLKHLRQLDDAAASYRRALEINPDFADAHCNLGNVLQDLGQFDAAAASYRRALEINPDLADAHCNIGNILQDLGQLDNAVASYRRALEIKPDLAEAHCNLGNVMDDLGQFDHAIASYRRALEIKPDLIEAHTNLLFMQHCHSNQPAAMLLDAAQRFGELAVRQADFYTYWPKGPKAVQYLRVGLVSGDLRNHPVGYFVEGMLAAFASNPFSKVEFIVYFNHSCSDALTDRIKACCHGWYSAVSLSDQKLARQIYDDGIDILIDLSGHTAHNRLTMFAWKPAPVQVSWLGYFGTTGVAQIDYLLADPWVLPKEQEVYFTEKIWRLPETRLCFTPPDVAVEVSSLPALRNGYITFGCFNNLSKMNDDVVALWAKILTAIPDSRLFLKAKQLNEISVQQNVIQRFANQGIGADRLILQGAESREKYLAAYHQFDIALDPFPFPGGTTSVEGLWMGVPVLTLAGERFLSRQGVGILMNAGLADWIASDVEDYVARAIAHARDVQALADLRGRLRQQVLVSPLFDAKRFAVHFEAALWEIWQQHWNINTSTTNATKPITQ